MTAPAQAAAATRLHVPIAAAAPAGPALPRRARHEVLLVAAGSLSLAGTMTWPVLRDPTRTVPGDLFDPLYFVWQLAWAGHALHTSPASIWTGNAFTRAPGNLAYTDTVLGYAPFSALIDVVAPGTGGALLAYNLLYVLTAALAFGSAYLLARVLGARWPAALVTASAFGFAPWRLAHAGHINVLSTGGIALTLALLAFGHGWSLLAARPTAERVSAPVRRPVRPGWVLAGWAVACWQLTLGFALGVPFGWVLAIVFGMAVVGWFLSGRPRPHPGLLAADLAGAAAFITVAALLTVPYRRVVAAFPGALRTDAMVHRYSPPLRGLITAPPSSWLWGGVQAGLRAGMPAVIEQAVLPGAVVTLLAIVGLRWSAWSVRARVLLALGALAGCLLAVGTSAPGGGRLTYLPLFHHLPGWEALRTPGRLVLWVILCLGLLAAGSVSRYGDWVRDRPKTTRAPAPRRLGVLLGVPAMLVLLEGVGHVAEPVVPRAPIPLAAQRQPVLVLPTSQLGDFAVMAWSTAGWPTLANGGSGFEPPPQAWLRSDARTFPDAASIARLRRHGVRTVVLIPSRAAGTPWQVAAARPTDGLPLTVERVGDAVVYHLR